MVHVPLGLLTQELGSLLSISLGVLNSNLGDVIGLAGQSHLAFTTWARTSSKSTG